MSFVFEVESEDDPEYYTIISELYNGLGRFQQIEYIRKIVHDERVDKLLKALETCPDLEVS